MKTSNKAARRLVDQLIPFTGSHLFAQDEYFDNKMNGYRLYVVYSYGHHWPMWVYDRKECEWIGTDSKYSVSTSRQQSQTRPTESTGCKLFHIEHLKEYVAAGGNL